MKLVYVGPHTAVELVTPSGSRVLVEQGAEVEVATAQGRELLKQETNWAEAKPKSPKPKAEVKKNGS